MKYPLCTSWAVHDSVRGPHSLDFPMVCTVVLYTPWCNPILGSQSEFVLRLEQTETEFHGGDEVPTVRDKFELG